MTAITTIERRYCPAEAVFLIRSLVGPDFGNLYTVLADQRRGKVTCLPVIRSHRQGNAPYYLSSDLMKFVQDVRADAATRGKAKAGHLPVYFEVDLEKEMML